MGTKRWHSSLATCQRYALLSSERYTILACSHDTLQAPHIHTHTHTLTVSSFSEKTPGGIASTQIKRETQLKHLAINSFISMSHKQCYRSAAVAATTAAVAAAATASGARYASITPCCSCYAVILCLFSEQSHTKRRGTASHLKRDCSALLNVAVLRGDNCVLRLLLCLLIRGLIFAFRRWVWVD